jgi:hypothetical protein
MQCAEPDDKLRYAINHPDRLMPLPGWQATAGAMFAQQSGSPELFYDHE